MQGRIAVVTGGARGIGRAIVDRFTAEGATVVIGDLTDPGEVGSGIDVAGRREWVPLDVTDETSVLEFAQSVEPRHGRPHVPVHTPGPLAERYLTPAPPPAPRRPAGVSPNSALPPGRIPALSSCRQASGHGIGPD